jgi:threonine dehydratase
MLGLQEIENARRRLAGSVYYSPLARSEALSQRVGSPLYLKLENLQMTGSFKERGALNRMLHLDEAEKARGVVAASAGNHAQAVAYWAGRLGVKSCITMPKNAPLTKIENTRRHGAEVVLQGQTYAEAYEAAGTICRQRGAVFVHAFDDPLVIAGQGTIGLELLEQQPELDAVVLPVGGGGLIAGCAVALKAQKPGIKIIGVEMASYPSAGLSLQEGRIVASGDAVSLADGIAVKQVGQIPFDLMQHHVDTMVTVSEEEVASAVLALLEQEKTVAEGAGAAALAAVLENKCDLNGGRTAVLVSGGNIDVNMVAKIIERGLARDGRRVRLMLLVPDRPGSLAGVTDLVATAGANVLEVYHERDFVSGPLGTTGLWLTLETRGPGHAAQIITRLEAEGYAPQQAVNERNIP